MLRKRSCKSHQISLDLSCGPVLELRSLLQTSTMTVQHCSFFSDELESCSSPLLPRKPRYLEACDFKAISTAIQILYRNGEKTCIQSLQQGHHVKETAKFIKNTDGRCEKTKYSSNVHTSLNAPLTLKVFILKHSRYGSCFICKCLQ